MTQEAPLVIKIYKPHIPMIQLYLDLNYGKGFEMHIEFSFNSKSRFAHANTLMQTIKTNLQQIFQSNSNIKKTLKMYVQMDHFLNQTEHQFTMKSSFVFHFLHVYSLS